LKYGVDDPWIVLDKPDCVGVAAAMSRRVRSRRVRKPIVYRDVDGRSGAQALPVWTRRVRRTRCRLAHDLDAGAWDRTHGHIRSLPEIDVGLRLLIADLA